MFCTYGVVVYCAVGWTWAVWCNVVLYGIAHGGVLYFVTCVLYSMMYCVVAFFGIMWCVVFCVVCFV